MSSLPLPVIARANAAKPTTGKCDGAMTPLVRVDQATKMPLAEARRLWRQRSRSAWCSFKLHWELLVKRPLALGRGWRTAGKGLLALVVLALLNIGAWQPLPQRDQQPAAVARDALPSSLYIQQSQQVPAAATVQKTVMQLKAEGRAAALEHHLRILAADGPAELYRGNAVDVLNDGPDALEAMRKAIQSARDRVFLQTFIFEHDGAAGAIGEALAERARTGVAVALLVDAVGSVHVPDAYWQALRRDGVSVCLFNPLNPVSAGVLSWRPNHRSHRKLMVVDGAQALTGGINISSVYGISAFSGGRDGLRSGGGGSGLSGAAKPRRLDSAPSEGWRDTHVALRGPAAAALAAVGAESWHAQRCPESRAAPSPGAPSHPHAAPLAVDGAVAQAGMVATSRQGMTGNALVARAIAPPSQSTGSATPAGAHHHLQALVALHRAWHPIPAEQTVVLSSGLPSPGEVGARVVKVLSASPDTGANRIYTTLVRAVDAARHSVRITTAYFAPGPELVEALQAAAGRGVKVQLLLPGVSDSKTALAAGRSYYGSLLRAGVEIHELNHTMLHAKTFTVDGVLSSVGSSNLDFRSLALNDELNLLVLGDDFATVMEAVFAKDLATAEQVQVDTWHQRPWLARTHQWGARLLERWL